MPNIIRYLTLAMAIIVTLCTLTACGTASFENETSDFSTTTTVADDASNVTTVTSFDDDNTTTQVSVSTSGSSTSTKSSTASEKITSTTAKNTTKSTTSSKNSTKSTTTSPPIVSGPYVDTDKCDHKNTELVAKEEATLYKDGYTGSVICQDCAVIIKAGKNIARLEETDTHMAVYDKDYNRYIIEKGLDPLLYSLKKFGNTTNRIHKDTELSILKYTNMEREKEGLPPLQYLVEATYYTYIRAQESSVYFSHSRVEGDAPDSWYTVYENDGMYKSHGKVGENLGSISGSPCDILAELMVEAWMESPGHRAQILNPDYTHLAVGVCLSEKENTTYCVQHFFEFKE